MAKLSVLSFVCLCVVHQSYGDISPKTTVHIYGEEHFLKEASFDSATVKGVYPQLKAPIYQLLQNPLFVLVKSSDKATAVFLPEGLSKPTTFPSLNPSLDVMLRSFDERYSLLFSLAHFPFKHFKEVSINDFATNAKLLRNVPLTDIPVMTFYTKNELDEMKTFFKFFYMGDLEITSNVVTPNNRKSYDTVPNPADPVVGYPYQNRLPNNHPQKHAYFLAPVPLLVPKQSQVDGVHGSPNNHNILNRSPEASPNPNTNAESKSAADLPVYSYKSVPLYIPKSLSLSPESSSPSNVVSSFTVVPHGSSSTPVPSSTPSSFSPVSGSDDAQQHVSYVFPSTSKPYPLPSGYATA